MDSETGGEMALVLDSPVTDLLWKSLLIIELILGQHQQSHA